VSKVVAFVAFAAAGVLFFIVPWCNEHAYECSECSSPSDCGEGLSCRPFNDGTSRCVDEKYVCAQGQIETGATWSHMSAVAALLVGAAALSSRRLTAQRGSARMDRERVE
jgi:hypothetical protein